MRRVRSYFGFFHGPGELHHTFQDVEELPEWQAQRTLFEVVDIFGRRSIRIQT